MSVIQKKPFIERVLDTFTMEQKQSLISLINGSDEEPSFRSLVNKTYNITEADKGVNHIILETQEKRYTGYLLYNSNYCVFVAYKNIQELNILQINPVNQRYEIVKEPLTILELRFELGGGSGGSGDEPKKIEVSNITSLTDEEINGLNAGDLVEKKTGNQLHTYVVSYKENNTGICLTYTDASVVETVSYDYTGGHWVYNSTDITPLNNVEGNPTVPVGTTPTDLTGLKVGNTYYKTGIPTVSIALSQILSADPLQIQLTDAQYDIFANNQQVIIDLSALEQDTVLWQYFRQDLNYIVFGIADTSNNSQYWNIFIAKSNKEVSFDYGNKNVEVSQVRTGNSADAGLLLAMDSMGDGTLTNNLPILTTAPSSDNSEGGLIIVVLSQEPATYYNGYLYLIQDSQV